MPPSSRSKDFSQVFRSSEKELNSEKFYDAMDMNPEDLHNYDEKRNNLIVTEAKDQMKQICKKYLRFLHISKTWRRQFTGFDVSLLLSYWLYEKLIKIYRHRDSNQIILGFSDIQAVWANFFNYKGLDETHVKNCKPELKLVDHEDWENRKKLYDYYVDYDYISNMAKVRDDDCKYYNKIKDKKSLYAYFAPRFAPGSRDCPEFYEQCIPYKPDNVLSKLLCHSRMEQEDAAPPGHTKESSSHHPSGEADSMPGPGGIRGLEGPEAASDNQLGGNSDIRTKVTNSVLGAAPVLLTATMLYRYTPLGPWIRRFGGGRTNSMNAMDTLSAYTQQTGDMFSNDSENYISYQPI